MPTHKTARTRSTSIRLTEEERRDLDFIAVQRNATLSDVIGDLIKHEATRRRRELVRDQEEFSKAVGHALSA